MKKTMLIVIGLISALGAFAIDYNWTGNGLNDSWNNPQNWSPLGVPGAADAATLGSNKPITLASSVSVLYYSQLNGTLDLNGNNLVVTSDGYINGGSIVNTQIGLGSQFVINSPTESITFRNTTVSNVSVSVTAPRQFIIDSQFDTDATFTLSGSSSGSNVSDVGGNVFSGVTSFIIATAGRSWSLDRFGQTNQFDSDIILDIQPTTGNSSIRLSAGNDDYTIDNKITVSGQSGNIFLTGTVTINGTTIQKNDLILSNNSSIEVGVTGLNNTTINISLAKVHCPLSITCFRFALGSSTFHEPVSLTCMNGENSSSTVNGNNFKDIVTLTNNSNETLQISTSVADTFHAPAFINNINTGRIFFGGSFGNGIQKMINAPITINQTSTGVFYVKNLIFESNSSLKTLGSTPMTGTLVFGNCITNGPVDIKVSDISCADNVFNRLTKIEGYNESSGQYKSSTFNDSTYLTAYEEHSIAISNTGTKHLKDECYFNGITYFNNFSANEDYRWMSDTTYFSNEVYFANSSSKGFTITAPTFITGNGSFNTQEGTFSTGSLEIAKTTALTTNTIHKLHLDGEAVLNINEEVDIRGRVLTGAPTTNFNNAIHPKKIGFIGNTNQDLFTTGESFTVEEIILDKSQGTAIMDDRLTVVDSLILLGGHLVYKLTNGTGIGAEILVTDQTSVRGGSKFSHVLSGVKMIGAGAFTFPVGDSLRYRPITFGTSANNSPTAEIEVNFRNDDPSELGSFNFNNDTDNPSYEQADCDWWFVRTNENDTRNVIIGLNIDHCFPNPASFLGNARDFQTHKWKIGEYSTTTTYDPIALHGQIVLEAVQLDNGFNAYGYARQVSSPNSSSTDFMMLFD